MEMIILEGTLTKVTSSRARKAEITLGKVEICWQITDPEQVGLLTMLQNGLVRITIENPQMEMLRRQAEAEKDQYKLDLDGECSEAGEDEEESSQVRFQPGHHPEPADDPFEGGEITSEDLEEEIKTRAF